MKIYLIYSLMGLLFLSIYFFAYLNKFSNVTTPTDEHQAVRRWWNIQSIDTVKVSRDLAREKNGDNKYLSEIETVLKNINNTGATYVSVGTPYDEEFRPFLTSWVNLARKNGLKIWFRGNWSGWENWFDYPTISKEEHIQKTAKFILSNPNLFENGDIFTPCTECENGALGDPRFNGNLDDFRNFIKNEYSICTSSFKVIGKTVDCGLIPMNLDVAKLVMDKDFADNFRVVTVDHYTKSPEKFIADLEELHRMTSKNIVLGEFGVPIPDIHGEMSEDQQKVWLDQVLRLITELDFIEGLNYWTAVKGTSSIWTENGKERAATAALSKYFKPQVLSGIVSEELGQALANVEITISNRSYKTDNYGRFQINYIDKDQTINFIKPNFKELNIDINQLVLNRKVFLKRIGLIIQ